MQSRVGFNATADKEVVSSAAFAPKAVVFRQAEVQWVEELVHEFTQGHYLAAQQGDVDDLFTTIETGLGLYLSCHGRFGSREWCGQGREGVGRGFVAF